MIAFLMVLVAQVQTPGGPALFSQSRGGGSAPVDPACELAGFADCDMVGAVWADATNGVTFDTLLDAGLYAATTSDGTVILRNSSGDVLVLSVGVDGDINITSDDDLFVAVDDVFSATSNTITFSSVGALSLTGSPAIMTAASGNAVVKSNASDVRLESFDDVEVYTDSSTLAATFGSSADTRFTVAGNALAIAKRAMTVSGTLALGPSGERLAQFSTTGNTTTQYQQGVTSSFSGANTTGTGAGSGSESILGNNDSVPTNGYYWIDGAQAVGVSAHVYSADAGGSKAAMNARVSGSTQANIGVRSYVLGSTGAAANALNIGLLSQVESYFGNARLNKLMGVAVKLQANSAFASPENAMIFLDTDDGAFPVTMPFIVGKDGASSLYRVEFDGRTRILGTVGSAALPAYALGAASDAGLYGSDALDGLIALHNNSGDVLVDSIGADADVTIDSDDDMSIVADDVMTLNSDTITATSIGTMTLTSGNNLVGSATNDITFSTAGAGDDITLLTTLGDVLLTSGQNLTGVAANDIQFSTSGAGDDITLLTSGAGDVSLVSGQNVTIGAASLISLSTSGAGDHISLSTLGVSDVAISSGADATVFGADDVIVGASDGITIETVSGNLAVNSGNDLAFTVINNVTNTCVDYSITTTGVDADIVFDSDDDINIGADDFLQLTSGVSAELESGAITVSSTTLELSTDGTHGPPAGDMLVSAGVDLAVVVGDDLAVTVTDAFSLSANTTRIGVVGSSAPKDFRVPGTAAVAPVPASCAVADDVGNIWYSDDTNDLLPGVMCLCGRDAAGGLQVTQFDGVSACP